ncbi:MAG: hypothetical protein AVDCRST_MAG87-2787 [uncultured Thermomicrobiales bacterium]|uniref:Uncharacterized protein n=1 Tax=uncultured Thermomicrobiales bacterium TaxID=1645740 RepID=A0A6J4VEF9_9BACT|nr:MAG: hypothetical protein AVDCRST_MAG87-2787 [uncultured Thermomicrobiales bacterium]
MSTPGSKSSRVSCPGIAPLAAATGRLYPIMRTIQVDQPITC